MAAGESYLDQARHRRVGQQPGLHGLWAPCASVPFCWRIYGTERLIDVPSFKDPFAKLFSLKAMAAVDGPTNATSLVAFSSLIGFDVRFDADKAGESGHSVLVHPVGNRRLERPYNLLAVGLGTLLAALLLCRVINGYKLPQMDCWWNS
jgi:hypothetical protein